MITIPRTIAVEFRGVVKQVRCQSTKLQTTDKTFMKNWWVKCLWIIMEGEQLEKLLRHVTV